ERVVAWPVVAGDGGERVAADVGVLVAEAHRFGPLDPPLADLLAVEVEVDLSTLAESASVVPELHPDLVLAGPGGPVCPDDRFFQPDEVVAEGRHAVLEVEGPASGLTTEIEECAVRAVFGDT